MRGLAAAIVTFLLSSAHGADLDHRAYAKAFTGIFTALQGADFAALERMHEQFLEPDARALDGTWMVQAFQEVFESSFRFEAPAAIEKRFAGWKRLAPRSTLRPIAEAFAWQQRAWVSKGSRRYAELTSAERRAFDGLIARAADALREEPAAGARSPLWHTAAILTAGAQARPASDLDTLLEEAVRRFPAYVPLFAARMEFLLPEWGGDFAAVDRFVRTAMEGTRALEGRAMYAWLYLEIARRYAGLFDRSLVSWPEMRTAFEDMVERHPDVWNRNVYATFACRARDAETTLRLLGELGAAASLGMWSPGVSTESCLRMVRTPPPPSRQS